MTSLHSNLGLAGRAGGALVPWLGVFNCSSSCGGGGGGGDALVCAGMYVRAVKTPLTWDV